MLGDMVRVIRMFRPLVIYSRWGGTSADGHGHHQLAGYLTPLAFKAAADPNEFPEQLQEGLRPWRTRKLYSRPLEPVAAWPQALTCGPPSGLPASAAPPPCHERRRPGTSRARSTRRRRHAP